MKSAKKTLVTGIKPTGKIHLGNYSGAIKPFLDVADEYESIMFIADLHALTSQSDPKALSQDIIGVTAGYLACGIDPKKTLIFKQSDVPEISELTWIFNCLTTMPYLMRAHAFKDAEAKNKEINVGVFDYPILMASDILIQDADAVPVGLDQQQHLEIARDTARKFNSTFGETFREPEALILEETQTIPGTDGRKMSKSYKNTIGLFDSDEEIKKAVMGIPTDSKGVDEPKNPDEDNVFNIMKFYGDKNDVLALRKRYTDGGIGYKEAKEILIESLIKFITPLREKRKEFEDEKKIKKLLDKNGEVMRKRAVEKMKEVKEKVGLK